MSLFMRLLAQSHPSDSLIVPHPRLSNLRSVRVLFVIFLLLMLGLTVSETLITRVTLGETAFPWSLLSLMLIWLCGIGLSFVIEQRWKPLETLRLAAARGDHHLLANAQPQPNPEALHVPVKIAMRLSQKGLLVFGLALSLLLILFANLDFLLTEWLQHLLDPSIWPWLLSLTVIVGAVMAFVLAVAWRQRWMVEVREEGIRSWVKSLGMTEKSAPFMPWQEARLFACYRMPGLWKKDSALIYELSSASQVILWTWVQRKESLRAGQEPTLPFEEHQAQMRALCELITAKTGLSLYDLRRDQVLKRENLLQDQENQEQGEKHQGK